MKKIYNWEKATVFDIEADALLDEATKMHILSCEMSSGKEVDIRGDKFNVFKKFINYHLENEIPVIAHNGVLYDVPLMEKILDIDLSKLMVIDTLVISWYLNIERKKHGLDSFLEDYGIEKPKIADDEWNKTFDTEEEREEFFNKMKHRCRSDVKINKALWEDLKSRLVSMYTTVKHHIDVGDVDGRRTYVGEVTHIDSLKGLSVTEHIDRLLTFLMFKADTMRIREKTRILIDQDLLESTDKELSDLLRKSQWELEGVMPPVPEYVTKNFPKKPLLQDNKTLSASGKSWNKAIEGLEKVDEYGTPLTIPVDGNPNRVKILKKYNPPNINSSDQIKRWLFSKGWKPETFKYVKDNDAQQLWVDSGFKKELKPKPRAIPQLSRDSKEGEGKELCPSVLKLSDRVPEIKAYSGYTLLKHRYDCIQGFKREMSDDGYVTAKVKGLTNTLRERHSTPVVNLPSASKPYGSNVRGLLSCKEGQVLLGSDLSSLEDNVKNHFCLAYDPDYVKSVNVEGYDPHLAMAVIAGFITEPEQAFYKWYSKGQESDVGGLDKLKELPKVSQSTLLEKISQARSKGKTTNYASIYGAGPETISRESGMSLEEAKTLHKAYWELHSYVKKIADDQFTFYCEQGLRWLINPINGFCYNIRTEKDIFSTLIQGTGSYFFDMWVDNIITEMYNRWGKAFISLLYHDEIAFPLQDKESTKSTMSKLVKDAIAKVNDNFLIRVKLGCGVDFGNNYSEIH